MALGGFAPMVMAVVVAFVILVVGLFVFSTTLSEIENMETDPETQKTISNIGDGTIAVFEILPIVIIIAIIASVLGVVYNFGRSSTFVPPPKKVIKQEDIDEIHKEVKPKYPNVPKEVGDYRLHRITDVDDALEIARELRNNGYWTKLTKYTHKKYKLPETRNCAVYISNWRKEDSIDNGKPKWRII